jgi:hypothetical protein
MSDLGKAAFDQLTGIMGKTTEILSTNFTLYEPPTASNQWVTDGTGKVLNMNTTQFLALFYDPSVGTQSDGLTVTKRSLGKDQSGLYDLYEYDFKPKNYSRTILLSSGMHTYELSASFGLAHFFMHLMTRPYLHDGFKFLRENVRIKFIPIINPWGFNQNPKTYGNSRGVNPNRNFDSNGRWAAYEGNTNEFDQKGTAPFSEAETQILRDWALANPNAQFWIDMHTGLGLGPWDNFIYTISKDPLYAKITETLVKLENRIKTKYGKPVPITEHRINNGGVIRNFWALEQVGIGGMVIEQTPNNLLWGTASNNEGGDITEFEVTICAYVFALLAPGFSSENTLDFADRRIYYLEHNLIPNLQKTIDALSIRLKLLDGGIILSASFNQADNALTIGSADTGQVWISEPNPWGISGNQAYSIDTAGTNYTYTDIGKSDFTVSVKVKFSVNEGIVFRFSDANNSMVARINTTSLGLIRNVVGTGTVLQSYNFTPVVGTVYTIKVVCVGSSIQVYLDGVLRITATEPVNQLWTKVGLRTVASTAGRFDDCTVIQSLFLL